uniref:Uncharacterized protein n=1 Tax=Parascaris univalens TaxID=6257 RepID=A0A914ZYT7_PARUN
MPQQPINPSHLLKLTRTYQMRVQQQEDLHLHRPNHLPKEEWLP